MSNRGVMPLLPLGCLQCTKQGPMGTCRKIVLVPGKASKLPPLAWHTTAANDSWRGSGPRWRRCPPTMRERTATRACFVGIRRDCREIIVIPQLSQCVTVPHRAVQRAQWLVCTTMAKHTDLNIILAATRNEHRRNLKRAGGAQAGTSKHTGTVCHNKHVI